jgi:endonuclease YncB( thermonuclease family)
MRRHARLIASGLFMGILVGIAFFSADHFSSKFSSKELAAIWERYKDFGDTEQKPSLSPQNRPQVRSAPPTEQELSTPPEGFEEHYRRPAVGERPAYLGPPASNSGDQNQSAVRIDVCVSATRVNCVVDGDTIWLHGVKIRIADIDTPEIFSPKCASEKARGERAKYRLVELLNVGPFQLVRYGDRDADRYGRKLRVIERDGQSLGMILVGEGLARRWDGARRPWC